MKQLAVLTIYMLFIHVLVLQVSIIFINLEFFFYGNFSQKCKWSFQQKDISRPERFFSLCCMGRLVSNKKPQEKNPNVTKVSK